MKREFLQSLPIGEQGLPKEMVDAIMDENGRDIENAKKPYADYQSLKEQLKTYEGVDVQELSNTIAQLRTQLEEKDSDYAKQLAQRDFSAQLEKTVTAAGGRSLRAITALLDLDALQSADDREVALSGALEALKQSDGYLFRDDQTPPPYARGTGARQGAQESQPATLAGALRERIHNERK